MFTNRLFICLIALPLFMYGCMSATVHVKQIQEMSNAILREQAELKNLRLSKITPIEKPLATRALVIVPSDSANLESGRSSASKHGANYQKIQPTGQISLQNTYWNMTDERIEVLRRRQIFREVVVERDDNPENMSLSGYDITIFRKKEEPIGPYYIKGSAADEAQEIKEDLRRSPPRVRQTGFSSVTDIFESQAVMIRDTSEFLSKIHEAWLDEVAKMTIEHLGRTQLMFACEMGQFNFVKLLIDKGANINAKSNNGLTALMVASGIGHQEVAQLLIAKGADVNAKKNNGGTALMLASQKGHQEVAQLLIAKGADVNAKKDNGGTALMLAAQRGHREVVQLLIDKGADVKAQITSEFPSSDGSEGFPPTLPSPTLPKLRLPGGI